jgi:hypothetical protein
VPVTDFSASPARVLFLKATKPFFNGSSGSFLDRLENLVLLDSGEIVGGGGLPPVGHVESECSS